MNRRIFDGIVLTAILIHGALIIPRMGARRWSREEKGTLGTVGNVVQIGLGQ